MKPGEMRALSQGLPQDRPEIRRAIEDWKFFCQMWHLHLRQLPTPLAQAGFETETPPLPDSVIDGIERNLDRDLTGMQANMDTITRLFPNANFDIVNCEVSFIGALRDWLVSAPKPLPPPPIETQFFFQTSPVFGMPAVMPVPVGSPIGATTSVPFTGRTGIPTVMEP